MKMENLECIKERLVVRAATSGSWDDELLAHLASCNVCRESLDVSRWMQELAEVPGADHPLPNAQYVWWKAQFLEKELAEERATRPLLIAQFISYAVIALGVIGLMLWKMSQIQQWLSGSIKGAAQTVSLSSSTYGTLSLVPLVLFSVLLILGLRAFWLED
jgi:hypothetical protein